MTASGTPATTLAQPRICSWSKLKSSNGHLVTILTTPRDKWCISMGLKEQLSTTRCIWGNLLPQWKRAFKSLEKISSRDLNYLAEKYTVKEEAFANSDANGGDAVLPVLTRSDNYSPQRAAQRQKKQLRGIPAIATAKPLPRADTPGNKRQVRTKGKAVLTATEQVRIGSGRTQSKRRQLLGERRRVNDFSCDAAQSRMRSRKKACRVCGEP